MLYSSAGHRIPSQIPTHPPSHLPTIFPPCILPTMVVFLLLGLVFPEWFPIPVSGSLSRRPLSLSPPMGASESRSHPGPALFRAAQAGLPASTARLFYWQSSPTLNLLFLCKESIRPWNSDFRCTQISPSLHLTFLYATDPL